MNMSSLVTLLIKSYLPEAYQKYLYLNYSQSSEYRTYKSFVPDYLKGRPRSTILHCLHRKAKALKYSSDDVIVVDEQLGIFEVKGSKGKTHIAKFGLQDHMPQCTCLDWVQWNLPCKHFFAIFRIHSKWNWAKLPLEYLQSPYLTIDTESLGSHFGDPSLNGHSVETSDDAPVGGSGMQEEIQGDPTTRDIPNHKVVVIYISNSVCYPMQTFQRSMRQAGESARTSLKVLETLTYSCTEPKDLWELHASIEELVTGFRAKLPKQDSLVLRPHARITARKRAKAISHKYRALPLRIRRGRVREDWRHRSRVGQKANALRKVHGTTIIISFVYLLCCVYP